MNGDQILSIFSDLNNNFGANKYLPGTWLECDEIAAVVTNSNQFYYPDDKLQLFFDVTLGLMKSRKGKYITINGNKSFEAEKEMAIIPFSDIANITLVNQIYKKSAYRIGSSL